MTPTPKQRIQVIATKLRKLKLYDQRKELALFVVGRSIGLSQMGESELVDMQNYLNQIGLKPKEEDKQTRNYLLYMLHNLGYIDYTNGKNDYTRANNYIKKIGTRNPRAAEIYKLTSEELLAVTTQVEQRYKKEIAP